jgi:type II secretion system protein N
MNRVGLIVGGAIWSAFVFVSVFYLAFPSEAVGNRISYEVRERTGGEYELELGSVYPWWVGVSASKVVASKVEPSGELMPFFLADAVGVRVGLFSLLSSTRNFTAYIGMGDANVDVQAGVAIEEGKASLRNLKADAAELEIGELLALAGAGGGAADVELGGTLDIEIDLDMRNGMEKADGDVSLSGSGLQLVSVAYPAGSDAMMLDAPVDEFDLRLRGDEGVFEITRGILDSTIAVIELEGEARLGDRLDRSRIEMKAELELGDWSGTEIESLRGIAESALGRAKWSDDKYHYTANTTLGRFDFGDFRADREPTSRRSTYTPPTERAPTPTRTPTATTTARPPIPLRPTPTPREPELDDEMLDDEFDDEEFEDEEFEDEEGEGDEEDVPEVEGY